MILHGASRNRKSARRTLDLTLTARGASVRARETTVSGAVVGIGEIPITIDIPGYRPGGAVEEGIVNGLLPRCQADGGRLVDVTKVVKEALKTGQTPSDEGRTAVKFKLNPLTRDLVIEGGVKEPEPFAGRRVTTILCGSNVGPADFARWVLEPIAR